MDYLSDQNALVGGERESAAARRARQARRDPRRRRHRLGLPRHRAPPGRRGGHPDRADARAAGRPRRRPTRGRPGRWCSARRARRTRAASARSRSAPRTSRARPGAWSRSTASASTRRAPASGSPVDALILALGFTGPDARRWSEQLGVALDARGNIAVDARYATSVPGVYCAGDAHRGASLIVWAIAEGRELARHVDAALRHERSSLPARGQDLPF